MNKEEKECEIAVLKAEIQLLRRRLGKLLELVAKLQDIAYDAWEISNEV